jgi:regulator of sigma E protease
MVFIGILVAFIIFSIVVLIHEYGHFASARFFWVRVEEFGLGIPPRAKKLWRDKNWTLFSLNWLPIGGFVKLSWEQVVQFQLYDKQNKRLSNEQITQKISKKQKIFDRQWSEVPAKDLKIIGEKIQESQASYNLNTKPAWQQSIVILAGVFMNFVLASCIFAGLFLFWVRPVGINDTIKIQQELKLIPTMEQALDSSIVEKHQWVYLYPLTGSLAEKSGILQWDLLLSINDTDIWGVSQSQEIIWSSPSQELSLYIKRTRFCEDDSSPNCPIIEFQEVFISPDSEGKIWSYLAENLKINNDFTYQYGFIESLKYGVVETYGHARLTLKALWVLGEKILFPETKTERKEAVNQLSGPIGIVDFISNSLSGGIVFLIIIGAIISVNLWVFNLLPIPALDWGRLVFILSNGIYNTLTGKKWIPAHIEWSIHVLFFMILIGLSFLIAYNDIVKIFNR